MTAKPGQNKADPQRNAVVRLMGASTRTLDEPGLVEAVLAGDEAAVAELWDRLAPLMRGLLCRVLGSRDVEDELQDVFLALYRGIGRLADRSALRGYAVGIAYNTARMELRRRRRKSTAFLEDAKRKAAEPAVPARDNQAAAALAELYRILDELDVELRLAFVSRYVEQLSVEEVARILRCSQPTAKRRIRRARSLVVSKGARNAALAVYLPRDAKEARS